MFKNLKSKLEDEAKKIQASVQQYSEQIQQQVGQMRSNTVIKLKFHRSSGFQIYVV